MTPLEVYQQHIDDQRIEANPYQLQAIQRLDIIQQQLIKRYKKRSSAAGKIRRKIKPRPPIKGLYLWGSVGIGKTYVIDIFFNTVPVPKLRLHFHEFMQQIRQALIKHEGEKNPLQKIAKEIADQYLVIFLDEFLVSDITNAMVLARLLRALFANGACIITTSNTAPKNLYINGIQREQFLPAITLLQTYTTVIHQQSIKDYRRNQLTRTNAYFSPLTTENHTLLEETFDLLTHHQSVSTETIHILDRPISVIKKTQDIIWFDFNIICNSPRSQNDYIELCKQYHIFLVSEIPIIQPEEHHLIIPFIKFIDVLYDRKKRLILSAQSIPSLLYPRGKQRVNFERTISRIIEMGSKKYLDAWHQQSAGLS
ncbi:MAG: cell division protein ZapE [Coxiellaceae bacterium]|nr:cell division protein ZapE [Coxiellaceae bacterium]|tara:strand:- start:9687 stop:10790 length:1104 start_codon:yes stop_codon:yes gene_type:complete